MVNIILMILMILYSNYVKQIILVKEVKLRRIVIVVKLEMRLQSNVNSVEICAVKTVQRRNESSQAKFNCQMLLTNHSEELFVKYVTASSWLKSYIPTICLKSKDLRK
jgi:hypothetical protein